MLRRRVTLIVKMSKGFLIGKHIFNWKFALLGGGLKFGESYLDAVRRELREETNLECMEIKYLFELKYGLHRHKVFLVEARGEMKFNWEIRDYRFVSEKNYGEIKLKEFSRRILERYFAL